MNAAPGHVMLIPDILFLVFEHLPLRRLCHYRLVCREWDLIYRTIRDSTLTWSNTGSDTTTTLASNSDSEINPAAPPSLTDVSRVTTLQCDFVQVLGDRETQNKLDNATKVFLENFSDRCRRGKLDGWREWILTGWFNPFVVVVPHASVMPWTLERLSMTTSRPVAVDVLSILFRLPQLVSFELRWSNLGVAGMIESQYIHFPISNLEAGSTLEQVRGLEGTYPDVDRIRLERLKMNGFRLTPMELYQIAQRAPNLEFIQLTQGLKGNWANCNLANELGQLCPRLRHVHITGDSGTDDADPVYRPVLRLMANLPTTVESVGLRHADVYRGAEDSDSLLKMDTMDALDNHGRHWKSLYLSQYYETSRVTNHLFHHLAKFERLESFYAPFATEFDISSLDPSHLSRAFDLITTSTTTTATVTASSTTATTTASSSSSSPSMLSGPLVFPKLRALELAFTNSARGASHFGIHTMAKSVNAILKTIVKTMPNLEHLHLRLGSRLFIDSHVKLRRLGQLRNLKTLIVVARMDDDLWDRKTLEWLRRPSNSVSSLAFSSSSSSTSSNPSTTSASTTGSPGSLGKKIFSSGKSSPPLLQRSPKASESSSSRPGNNHHDSNTTSNGISSSSRPFRSNKDTQQYLPHLERLELIRTGNQTSPGSDAPMDPRSHMFFQAAKDYLAEIRPEVRTVVRHKYSREIGRMIFHSEHDDTFVLRQF
ncbi:hypothetical protein DFQ27_003033 [Actinomortierella ambigua]|uniref:F-box domain-containing protein n=1 Tax=Actinomortierella ambigua TaxID=1343610 RepID=A0A9P6UCJ4_9FUNG|nr:hypothetical protein DFQ27_003033 [Actinomortierella ambigua]